MVQPLMSRKRAFVAALFLAAAAGFLVTLAMIGALPLPPDWGASTTQARTIALDGGSFGPVAQPPAIPAPGGGNPLVSFQGRLTNPGTGLPVANGSYSITFRIFETPAGGSTVWTETQAAVPVSGGLFNVMLGSVTPLDAGVFSNTNRYLEVQVSPDAAMTPRLQFGYVPYAFQAEQAGSVSLLGFSLTAVDSAGAVGLFTSVTVGTDGLPVISYWDNTNADLKVAHCGNASCSAGNAITTVDSAGDVGRFSSVTIGSDGLPIIAYMEFISGGLKVAHCGNAACTAGNMITTVASPADHTSITVGTDGLPVISYRDLATLTLKVAHCGNVLCSAGNTVSTVDGSGNNPAWTSITIGADGVPIISYYDFLNANLNVAHCGNELCSAGNLLTPVDTVGNVGQYTSITVGTDALPFVTYYDVTSDDLRVAHCGNLLCVPGGTTLTTLDGVGTFMAVTVGPEGYPIVGYFDGTNADLKMAHCLSVVCTSWTLTRVDTAGAVGDYVSITMGTDGLPVLSYRDISNGDLKIAHCSNSYCTPWNRPR